MTRLERAALDHAKEWLRYQSSPQAKRDAEIDRKRRAERDKAAGHLPTCGILKCSPHCKRGEA